MYTFLVFTHIVGTILGVGGATMIEVHLNKSLQRGGMSEDERTLLQSDYRLVRVGLILALLSGFGFLLYYKLNGFTAAMFDPFLWAKLSIVIVIACNTILLQARWMSLYWGAALSFVSWWAAALFGVFMSRGVEVDLFAGGDFFSVFSSLMVLYIVSVVIGAALLEFIRVYLYPKIV